MTDVTMMKIGSVLIVPIQVELHDSAAVQLQEDIVQNIEKTGAKEMKDMGKVMAELMLKIKGRAEGKEISRIVRELLSANQ